MKKGLKWFSILFNKCPRCHEGDFYKYRFNLWPSKILKLNDNCPKCNLKYMIEPSFFFGAMYVNYAIAVALFVVIFIIAKVLLNMSVLHSFIAILVVSFLLTPLTLRISRIIWINIFIHYDKDAITKNKPK